MTSIIPMIILLNHVKKIMKVMLLKISESATIDTGQTSV